VVEELEKLSLENAGPLERRLAEVGLWFHMTKDTIPQNAVEKRQDFLELAVDNMIELMAIQVQRQQRVEGHKSTSLWLPNGIVDKDTGKKYG